MDIATLRQILEIAFEKRVSDIHFEVDNPPLFRARGHLIRSKLKNLTQKDTEFIAQTIMQQNNRELPDNITEFDTSYTLSKVGRFRASIFRQRGNFGIVINNSVRLCRQAGDITNRCTGFLFADAQENQ